MSNYKGGVKNRRKRALDRLKAQLKTGTKTLTKLNFALELADIAAKMSWEKYITTESPKTVPLNEKDISRIKKEIAILEAKP